MAKAFLEHLPWKCPDPIFVRANSKQENLLSFEQLGVSKPMPREEPEGGPHTALRSHYPSIIYHSQPFILL